MTSLPKQWSEQIRTAVQEKRSLFVRGRNSLLGQTPEADTLQLSRWEGVVEYDPGELAITVRAGTAWSDLEATLAEQGQIPACAPLHAPSGRSVGGVVATGINGSARPWLGDIRGAVLGVAMLNGRGELLTFGGRVMKNVAGFDLSRLQTGAWGQFGPMLEISLRTRPAFQYSICRVLETPVEQLPQTLQQLRTLPLTGVVWEQGRLHVRLQGLESGVRQAAGMLGGEEDTGFWPALEQLQTPAFAATPHYRLVIPAVCVNKPAVQQALQQHHALLDWAGGLLWLHDEPMARLLAQQTGGWYQPWPAQAPPELPESRQQLVTGLRQAFDPQGIFRQQIPQEANHANPPA